MLHLHANNQMGSIDSKIKSKIRNDRHRFVTNLVYTANWVQQAFAEDIKPFGISQQQFNILRILNGIGDWVTMSEVKDGLLEKSPNATRLADKLLSKELIVRKASDVDRRVVYIKITSKGTDLFNEISQKESTVQKALLNNISAKDAKYVSDLLDKFRG